MLHVETVFFRSYQLMLEQSVLPHPLLAHIVAPGEAMLLVAIFPLCIMAHD